jgi:hypothetical protein
MQNKPMPTEGKNSDKLEAQSALCDAACCASSIMGVRIDVNPVELFREYRRQRESETAIRSARNTPQNPSGEKSPNTGCHGVASVASRQEAKMLWLSYRSDLRSAQSNRSSSGVHKRGRGRRGIHLRSFLRVAWRRVCGLICGLFLHNDSDQATASGKRR